MQAAAAASPSSAPGSARRRGASRRRRAARAARKLHRSLRRGYIRTRGISRFDHKRGLQTPMATPWRWIAAAALCALQAAAWAQPWPAKPIRAIVPFTPGSATDIMARTVAEKLSAQLGQPVLIENRPGAGGTIGAGAVAKADPDGYTILVHSSSYTVTPSTSPNLPYDTLRDLTGVTPLGLLPNVLVIAPSKGL